MALMGPGWHLWVRGVTYGSAPHLPTADGSFGPRLLELCNRGLLECLALNLHCLRGERAALGALLGDRIVSVPPP